MVMALYAPAPTFGSTKLRTNSPLSSLEQNLGTQFDKTESGHLYSSVFMLIITSTRNR